MEVKVVNTEVKPPFVCFTMEGLSAMGYRHTESPTKSGTQIGKCSDQTSATNIKMLKYKIQIQLQTHKKWHRDREMFRSGISNKYQNAKIQNTNTNTETQKVAHR